MVTEIKDELLQGFVNTSYVRMVVEFIEAAFWEQFFNETSFPLRLRLDGALFSRAWLRDDDDKDTRLSNVCVVAVMRRNFTTFKCAWPKSQSMRYFDFQCRVEEIFLFIFAPFFFFI